MWLFEFPSWIYLIILGVGLLGTIIGFFFSFIPFIKQYALPIQIVSVLILVLGVYFQGGVAVKNEFDKQVADLKVKLADAETKSEKINTIVVTRVLTKKEVVKEKGETVTVYIDREIKRKDDKCEMPREAIIAHNASAQNKTIDEVLTPNTKIDTKDHNSAAMRPSKK